MFYRSTAHRQPGKPFQAIQVDLASLLACFTRRIFRFSAVAVLTMLCCLAPASASSQNINSNIYVFGDSLSDTGNLFSRTGQPPRPYVDGRFSNGLLWDDRLANRLRTTLTPVTQIAAEKTAASINFAFGGATTGVDQTRDRLGLQQQVQLFREQHGQAANPNAVYLVWAGANDYLSGRSLDAAEPIANLRSAIASLIEAGAQRIVVGNLPALGQLPATRNRDSAATLDRLTVSHNQQLAALVAELGQRSGVTVQLLDVNNLFERAIAGEFKFIHVTEACLDAQRETICENPDEYLFWDGIHPTRAAHERISEAALPLSVVMSTPREFDRPAAPFLLTIGVLMLGSLAAIALANRAKKQR